MAISALPKQLQVHTADFWPATPSGSGGKPFPAYTVRDFWDEGEGGLRSLVDHFFSLGKYSH